MNYSFVIKTIFVSFFIFILIYALNFSSTQQDMVSSSNYGVKNTTKEALNIGDLRVNSVVTYDDDILLNATVNNYLKNNNLSIDDVAFDIAVNENIVTVKIKTTKNMLDKISNGTYAFSYEVERRN